MLRTQPRFDPHHESFSLKVDDVGINRRGVVQQVVVLVLEVLVEEGERAGSYRLAYAPGSGGRTSRECKCRAVNQPDNLVKTVMQRILN